MADTNVSPTRPPLSAWMAESLRLTILRRPMPNLDKGVWKTLMGVEPDVTTNQPRVGLVREEGSGLQGQCIVEQRPNRVDVVYTLGGDGSMFPYGTLPGTFEGALREFSELTATWLKNLSVGVQRMAFGAVALLPQQDRASGYRQLAAYLRCAPDVETSDFLYQINRRRDSEALRGAKVNRLSKWSVAQVQETQIPVLPAGPVMVVGEPRFACRVELDVNTAPLSLGELPRSAIVNHYRELIALATEILESGDIP